MNFGAHFRLSLLITGLIAFPAIAASVDPGVIQRVCSDPGYSRSNSELGRLLDEVQTRFQTFESRNQHRQEFVEALDEILKKSEFGHILACRDRLKAHPKFSYKLEFQDPSLGNQSMAVVKKELRGSDGSEMSELALQFNLHKSVARVIFVYLHELTHVCQAERKAQIDSNFSQAWSALTDGEAATLDGLSPQDWPRLGRFSERMIRADEAFGDIYRAAFLGEIEAFYMMDLAFSSLVQHSRRLCHEPGEPGDLPFFMVYVNGEEDLINGIHAQSIVSSYLDQYKPPVRYVLEPSSRAVNYKTAGGNEFTLKFLNRKLKQEVVELGIRVKESK